MKKMILFAGWFVVWVTMVMLSAPGISSAQEGGWIQTDWSGGAGQAIWSEAARYESGSGIDDSFAGQVSLASTKTVLFSDDFTRAPDTPDPLLPWVSPMGTWSVSGGVMQGSGTFDSYSYAYISGTWTDYMVQGSIQIPAGSFGGGIGGRLDPATGAHYGAWVYPAGSSGGSNMLTLWKFVGWTDIGAGVPMQQVSLPDVGTGWHILQMAFIGNRILVYYDGALKIDMTDNDFGSQAAYSSGGVSADWWAAASETTAISVDNVSVTTLPVYGSSGVVTSSAFDGGAGVQWQTVSWDAVAATGSTLCVRTRMAAASDQLTAAAWSDCYSSSGSALTGGNGRWIQYKLELGSSDSAISPFVYEVMISATGGAIPVITGLTPASTTAGRHSFTLTVDGSGFVNGSVVQWNGLGRPTTYVSPTQLTAAIAAADIAAAGTASVTVLHTAPGGIISNSQTFTINSAYWIQTDWAGGAGQAIWSDAGRYESGSGIDDSFAGQISLASTKTVLFSDDFTRAPDTPDPLLPWVSPMGTWSVSGGVMQGSGTSDSYSYAYMSGTWTDYMVQASIQIPAGSFGGGIGGRLNPATGAHYGAWVYPAGSMAGSNMLALWKFAGWTDVGAGVPMQQVSLPDLGTGWHILQMAFIGNRILVYYDGVLKIDMTDNDAYSSGGVSADWWAASETPAISVDNVSVTTLPVYGSSGVVTSSAFDGGEGVQWQTVSWDAAAAAGATLCVRTRTADASDQLAAAAWSDCYPSSGLGMTGGNRRWIQYKLELGSSDPSISPVVYEVGISATGGAFSAVDRITISPSSSSIAAGGSQAYTAEAFDQDNNSLGDVTGSATFAILPNGSCTGASCTAAVAGAHTVTGTYGGKTSPAATLQVKAVPVITWNTPADIANGTALSATQLNATASVPGSFVYTPPSGTVLSEGSGQTLHVDFTPTDSTNYNVASKEVTINVGPGYVKREFGGGTAYYSSLQTALGEAGEGDIIQTQELAPAEDITFDPVAAISVTVRGGYGSGFSLPPAGHATTMSSLSIVNGCMTVDGLILR